MRATQVTLLAVALLLPALARAADRCPWTDPGKKPRLFVDDRVVFFRDYYQPAWAACVIAQGAKGGAKQGANNDNKDFEIQWLLGSDVQTATILTTEKMHLIGGDEDGPRMADAKLFPGRLCEGEGKSPPSPQDKLVIAGTPGREYVAQPMTLRVRVLATGALAPLAYTSPPVEAPICRACSGGGGSLVIMPDENEKDLVLEGEADRAWFECASRGATLTLRGFGGQSSKEVTTAIRPDLIIDGLEKEFRRKGDKLVLRKSLPRARLCAHGAKVWSFEAWGRGELMHLGGGGRTIRELRCE